MNSQTQKLTLQSGALLLRFIAEADGVACHPVTREEVRAVNAGCGRATARRIMLAAVWAVGGMPAIREWRNRGHGFDAPLAVRGAWRMESALHDSVWMDEDEAEDFLAAARPHSFAGYFLT